MTNRLRLFVSTVGLMVPLVCIAQSATGGGAFGNTTGTDSARFGALVGASTGFRPSFAAPALTASAWGGAPSQSCAGVDFDTFLNTVKPGEVLNNLQTTYQSGPQAAVANYLLTLNTSNPTLAATLDMMDRAYSSRFQAFAQLCQAQETARLSSDPNTRRMAEASDQCFAGKVASGVSPTEALRECKNVSVVAAEAIPAKDDLKTFLVNNTNVTVTGEVEKLLPLLSDERITAQGVQVRAPGMSLTQLKGNIEDRAHNALIQILDGKKPDSIAPCKGEDYEKAPESASEACIPDAASGLVRGQVFLSARQLSSNEQDMYASALSEQMAAVTVQSTIIALRQSLLNMAPRNGATIPAGELATRRARIVIEIGRLENDALQLSKIADQRAQLARTQILAMLRANEQIAVRKDAAEGEVVRRQPNALDRFNTFIGIGD